jgi:hypothetical protein
MPWTGRGRWWTAPISGRSRAAQKRSEPVDRARTGSRHHLITEAHGIPLAVILTGGNRNDDIHQAFLTLACTIICWRR